MINVIGDNFEKIINNILSSKDTAKIGALDIFTGNADRNAQNMFYDTVTKKFTAIDNGSAYTLPFDYKSITKQLESKKLTTNQKENLDILVKTLKDLYNKYPPEKTIKKYDDYFSLAVKGMDENKFNKALKSRNYRVKNIEYNYLRTKEFLSIFDY
jgi:hypothetical protein